MRGLAEIRRERQEGRSDTIKCSSRKGNQQGREYLAGEAQDRWQHREGRVKMARIYS